MPSSETGSSKILALPPRQELSVRSVDHSHEYPFRMKSKKGDWLGVRINDVPSMTSLAGRLVALLSCIASPEAMAQGVARQDDQATSAQDPISNPATKSGGVYADVPASATQSPVAGSPANDPRATPGQSTNDDASSATGKGDIVVKGRQLRGSVVGGMPPERSYTPLDLNVYGADDVNALIRSTASQTASNQDRGGGAPLVLLNGRRVSSFSEIADIPTEAIERMEVFPEELALRYGSQPNRKVVNIVTYETFTSRVAQADYAVSTDGGYNRIGGAATLFTIRNALRINVKAQYDRAGTLLESERGIGQASMVPEAAQLRSILPATENLILNGVVSWPIKNDVAASMNVRLEQKASRSLLGAGSGGQITQKVGSDVLHLGTTLTGRAGKWLWSALGNYDRIDIGIGTSGSRVSPVSDTASSSNALGAIDVLANGPMVELPAGSMTLSLRAGTSTRDFVARSRNDPPTRLGRDRGAFQASLDIPIHKAMTATSVVGRLAVNANAAIESLSDFGTLRTLGYGVYWSPIPAINMYVSAARADGAPTIEQIGAPQIETPNVRAFDLARREPVDVARVFGGNPLLAAEDRRTTSIGFYARPLENADLALSIDYLRTRVDDPITDFPFATAEIEAAFPSRFTRDGSGRLRRIDIRPLNFGRSDQRRLRSGFNVTRPLGKGPPLPVGETVSAARSYPNEAAMRAALPPGTVVVEVAPDSEDARRIEALSSRVSFSVYHTWTLEDRLLPRRGGPTFDLLNGSATDFRGGTPRHRIECQAGFFRNGLGGRITTNWRSRTKVRGVADDDGDDLSFSAYSTTDVSFFLLPAQRLGGTSAPGWLKKMRLTLDMTNIFNARPTAIGASGIIPVIYQPAYLEPLGRVVNLRVRKIF